MTVQIAEIDTITSLSTNYVLTLNGSEVEQISQDNFLNSFPGMMNTSNLNTTTVPTSGTGETDLHTLTIASNTLSSAGASFNWHGIITATGVTAGGAMAFKLYIDAVSKGTITIPVLGNGDVNGGVFSISVVYLTASTGLFSVDGSVKGATSNGVLDYANTISIDFTSSFVIKITGTATSAGGDTPVGQCRFSALTSSIP